MLPLLSMLTFIADLAGATAMFVLGAWLFPRRTRLGTAGTAVVAGCAMMGAWALVAAAFGWTAPAALAMLSLSQLAWLFALYRFFANDGRHSTVSPVRAVVVSLSLVELVQAGLQVAAWRLTDARIAAGMVNDITVSFGLLSAIGGLVLVHNLYAGASPAGRQNLRWPSAALGAMWLFDLNLYTVAYLSGEMSQMLGALRGVLTIVMAVFLTLAVAVKNAEIRLRASRTVAFQSFSLVVIGAYFLGMFAVAQGISYLGSELAWLVQVTFLAAACVVALMVLPSRRLRSWTKVVLAKHLFQHRYDYRAEWLRFTETIAGWGENVLPLHERVIRAVAEITDSPAGLLLMPSEDGGAVLDSNWQWPNAEIPAVALSRDSFRYLEERNSVIDLDELRARRAGSEDLAPVPAWLLDRPQYWALVPLIHYHQLVGIVALARPSGQRKLDWEDFDLLRVVGRQLASYLAEQAGQEALSEAHRFDDFNRRIAFVMHDIKNLASQLSLLARNAEKHAEKAEFRADMLLTLRNSSDKLNTLLARLSRYGAAGPDKLERIDASECIARIAQRYEAQHPVQIVDHQICEILVDPDTFEQALVHIVQNAVEASEPFSPVLLSATCDGLYCVVEVIDSGTGMSPEFIRSRLFKPFNSSKPGGFGIGAFEARELIRAMDGQLSVDSRQGIGTRFVIRLPLADTAKMTHDLRKDQSPNTEAA